MRIFDIKFKFPVRLPVEEEYEEGEEVEYVDEIALASFQVGAKKLTDAYDFGLKYIKTIFEDDEAYEDCEIVEVSEISELNIVNWPDEENYYDFENVSSEDILNFKCAYCECEIKIKDGWQSIKCPSCKKEIQRDKVIGNNGKYFMVKTKE